MDETADRIWVFTGEGKGKTTAALGLALARAAAGERVMVVQFQKGGGYTGELFAQESFPNLTIRQFGHGCPIAAAIRAGSQKCRKCGECFRENRNPVHGYAAAALAFAVQILADRAADLVVLDEISHAVKNRLIQLADVIALVQNRPAGISLVLTGRNMPEELLNLADEATCCQAVKHPIRTGIDARRGSEY